MRVLVVAPHPDDESVGCGGTIRLHVEAGDEVHVVVVTSGEAGGHGRLPAATVLLREDEARRACGVLGTSPPEFWREPDGRLQVHDALLDRAVATVDALRPDRVYVTSDDDQHPDHRMAATLVRQAVSAATHTPQVLQYEVWTPLTRIDEITDISDVIHVKLAAIRAHASQVAALDFAAAFEGLARYRGEMHSWPGGPHAEVFSYIGSPP